MDFDDDEWDKWARINRDEVPDDKGLDWEIADKESDRYYKVHSFLDVYHGEKSIVHHIYDVSDYAGLFRELSEYTREWQMMSSCQSDLIRKLADDPCGCLSIAVRYFDVEYAVLYVDRRNETIRYIVKDGDEKPLAERIRNVDYMAENGASVKLADMGYTPHICCCSGRSVSGVGYGLFIPDTGAMGDRLRSTLYNEFKLYIENSLMQEQIVYESEHDHLSGLYNKGKFIELEKEVFPFAKSISVFNMDVNYLKRINDSMGHEAGNSLLIKAADSIRAVIRDNVYGFRVGGDEFLVVALNVDDKETEDIHQKWLERIDELNSNDDGIECVIACGIAHAQAPYELKDVLEQADSLMYADKRSIKLARGEDPDAR